MSFRRGSIRGVFFLMVSLLLVVTTIPALGQAAPVPIDVDLEVSGEVSAANIAPAFIYAASEPQAINIQVEATTPQFAPALRVLDDAGNLIEEITNAANTDRIDAVVVLPQAGPYIIQVYSASGFGGQFLIRLPSALPAPQPLAAGQVLDVSLSPSTPIVRFAFDASGQAELELVLAADTPVNATATLSGEAGDELARVSLLLTGLSLDIPANSGAYVVSLFQNPDSAPDTVRLSLQPKATTPPVPQPTSPPPSQPTQTPVPLQPLPQTGPCVAASGSGGRINVRSAPTTDTNNVVIQISGNQTLPVIGRLPDNSWLQVSVNGAPAWVASSVVRLGGECGGVPVVGGAPTQTPVPNTAVPGALADLVVGGLSVTPNNPVENGEFAINVTVSNVGGTAANNVLVRLSFDSDDMDISAPATETSIGSVPAGSAVTVNFIGIRGDDPGTVNVGVAVDPNNSIPETNDGNNSSSITVNVAGNDPDLIVSDIDIEEEDGSTQAGIRIFIRNQGGESAGDFQVAVNFDPPSVGQQIIAFDDLDPGETDDQFIEVDLGAFGSYSITVIADHNNAIGESNEGNNTGIDDFTLVDN